MPLAKIGVNASSIVFLPFVMAMDSPSLSGARYAMRRRFAMGCNPNANYYGAGTVITLESKLTAAMRANARDHGFDGVIACVRPTDKHRYPLIPIDRYAFWTNPDGEPFDAWIRLHVRLGGRIVRGCPEAMTIPGTVSEWETWTGLSFPGSGSYIVPFAAAPVEIDREADTGLYHDPNVWVVHALA